MILRLSQKLAKKIRCGEPARVPQDQNPFADWSCHVFTASRKQYILACNTVCLYSCVLAGAGITNEHHLIDRLLSQLKDFMRDDGLDAVFLQHIAPSAQTVQIAKALNRRVTGSMNQLVMGARDVLTDDRIAPPHTGLRLNEYLLSAIAGEGDCGYGSPKAALLRLVSER